MEKHTFDNSPAGNAAFERKLKEMVEGELKEMLERKLKEMVYNKPFEVTVDLREEKVRRNSQNILVSMERYEKLIKAEQDAEYLKEWVNKTAKSEKNGYEVKSEAVVLNTIFNESEE